MTICANNDASINIVRSTFTSSATDTPSLTLHYSANGSSSGFTVSRETSLLRISENDSTSSYIEYDEVNYTTEALRYYRKSRHRWDNGGNYGEIIIKHTTNTGARSVYICIPVIIIPDRSLGILERFINKAHDASQGDGNFTINNISFNSIVPRAPFISYTCNNNTYIVFDIDNALTLSSVIDNVLPVATTPTDSLYVPTMELNEVGPTSSTDEIYIDCQPTGTYGSEVVNQSVPTRNSTWYKKNINTILIIIAVIIVVGVVWILFRKRILSFDRPPRVTDVDASSAPPVRRNF